MAHVTLILGGARSGKSARALALAPTSASHVFIATAEALDAEMMERIRRHKAERGPSWALVEAPLELDTAVRTHATEEGILVVDCLTLWLSNLIHDNRDVAAETDALVAALRDAPGTIILVSNEIGLGLAPMESLSRCFRDTQGKLNQQIAGVAERVEFVAAGLPLVMKDDSTGNRA